MGHLHIESLCELSGRITHQLKHGLFQAKANNCQILPKETSSPPKPIPRDTYQANLLVLAPCLHHSRVVDAVDDDFVNSFCPKCVLVFKVVGNLLCGSAKQTKRIRKMMTLHRRGISKKCSLTGPRIYIRRHTRSGKKPKNRNVEC